MAYTSEYFSPSSLEVLCLSLHSHLGGRKAASSFKRLQSPRANGGGCLHPRQVPPASMTVATAATDTRQETEAAEGLPGATPPPGVGAWP